MKNSIANNHLSKASLGRGGDSMYRLVDGEMAHVNPVEASMIDAFGKKGEETVKERGSGTINPYTGNKEYFDPITAAMFGLSLYQGWKSTDMQRDSASAQKSLINKQMSELDKTEAGLEKTKGSRQQLAKAEFGQSLEHESAKTGETVQQMKENYAQTMQKSGGLVTSSAEGGRKKMWDRVTSAFTRGTENLMGQLGAKMGDIEGWYEGETSRIKAERSKLQSEQRVLSQQENQKFLGLF
jgi:hypothetical protein